MQYAEEYQDFFPMRLAQLRMKKGVSAQKMSRSIGQSRNYINMIENKRAFPSMMIFFYICEYLGVTPQEFFDTGNPHPQKLQELIEDLKKLDDASLANISILVKGLCKAR
jgi:transcriptional regulator with XRE-family HTH domain